MTGGPPCRGRLARRLAALTTGLGAAAIVSGWAGGTGAWATTLPLPAPQSGAQPLPGIGLRTDQLLPSTVPGPVSDREDITVGLLADGTPGAVSVLQRLALGGTGPYVIRERGPARGARAIGTSNPPVLSRGTVLWQGFSAGRRQLAATLTLDPVLERPRLPLGIRIRYLNAAGVPSRLGAGGRLPGAGTVTIQLTNRTTLPVAVTGGQARAGALGAVLQRLRAASVQPGPGAPPAAGRGLPAAVPGTPGPAASILATAPLSIRATVRVPGAGAQLAGPGTTATADGGTVAGTLDAGSVTLTLRVPRGGGRLLLDLTAIARLDPRALVPPGGAHTWQQWAAARPSAQALTAATATLMAQSANAARCVDVDRYLGADLAGTAAATFHFVLTRPARPVVAAAPLQTKPLGVALALVAAAAIAANLVLLWRAL